DEFGFDHVMTCRTRVAAHIDLRDFTHVHGQGKTDFGALGAGIGLPGRRQMALVRQLEWRAVGENAGRVLQANDPLFELGHMEFEPAQAPRMSEQLSPRGTRVPFQVSLLLLKVLGLKQDALDPCHGMGVLQGVAHGAIQSGTCTDRPSSNTTISPLPDAGVVRIRQDRPLPAWMNSAPTMSCAWPSTGSSST